MPAYSAIFGHAKGMLGECGGHWVRARASFSRRCNRELYTWCTNNAPLLSSLYYGPPGGCTEPAQGAGSGPPWPVQRSVLGTSSCILQRCSRAPDGRSAALAPSMTAHPRGSTQACCQAVEVDHSVAPAVWGGQVRELVGLWGAAHAVAVAKHAPNEAAGHERCNTACCGHPHPPPPLRSCPTPAPQIT
jgi:hypothetical protein